MNRFFTIPKTSPAPAILLGGGMIALAAARSLGKQGIPVVLLDNETSEACTSRFLHWLPLPYHHAKPEQLWIEWLMSKKTKAAFAGAVLFPCSDEGLEAVLNHYDELAGIYTIIEMDPDVNRAMLNKASSYLCAQKAGVPVPRVADVRSMEELESHLLTFQFPCALKPKSSHDFVKHFPALKMFIVEDRVQLMEAYRKVEEHGLEMLLTELIPATAEGYVSYYSYLDKDGSPLFHFTKRKLRQFPNKFGLGTFHVTDYNPDVARVGLKFFQAVGLRGLGNVEFMLDPRDNQLKFIECNARLTLTTSLVRASGIDMPLFAYNKVTGRPLPPVNAYKKGVYAIRPMSDALAFLEMRRNGQMTLVQWLRTILRKQHLLLFQWNDPMPSLIRFLPFLKRQFTKAADLARVPSHTNGSGRTQSVGENQEAGAV
jgi:D-aspartate ligase